MDENERTEGFQIKDRRRFTSDGEVKSQEEEPAVATAPGASERPGASPGEPSGRSDERAPGEDRDLPQVDFSGLIISLANTALFQLGLATAPGNEPKKDLPAARQTIDLIALLQTKTKGNVTEQEEKILSETLFQLRMAFVESSK